jgi:hypothetical protein
VASDDPSRTIPRSNVGLLNTAWLAMGFTPINGLKIVENGVTFELTFFCPYFKNCLSDLGLVNSTMFAFWTFGNDISNNQESVPSNSFSSSI